MSDAPTEGAEGEAPKSGRKGAIIKSLLSVVVVYGLSAAVAFAVLPPPDPEMHGHAEGADGGHAEAEAEEVRETVEVPTVLVNLAGSGGKRYLKAGIVVAYTTRKPEVAAARVEEKSALVRDALITLLSSKDQRAVDGREKIALLKLEISEELNKVLFPDELGEVDTVYFQDFIVQ